MRSKRVASVILIGLLAFFATGSTGSASFIYLYDFPGNPGSGLANDQTNPQFGNMTFSDWTRVNVTAGTTANAYDTAFWNTTSIFDSGQYVTFTITADAGYHLNLSQLTFDEIRISGGPTKGRVQMFLNGSATAFDVFDYNPSASWKSHTFDFTDTVDADHVTSVEFRFYGWNGGTADASLLFDNVGITVLGVVPEPPVTLPAIFLGIWFLGPGAKRKSSSKQTSVSRLSDRES